MVGNEVFSRGPLEMGAKAGLLIAAVAVNELVYNLNKEAID
jgi:hypothetical protein